MQRGTRAQPGDHAHHLRRFALCQEHRGAVIADAEVGGLAGLGGKAAQEGTAGAHEVPGLQEAVADAEGLDVDLPDAEFAVLGHEALALQGLQQAVGRRGGELRLLGELGECQAPGARREALEEIEPAHQRLAVASGGFP